MAELGSTPGIMAADALAGGGQMGELVRSFDWSATPIGPVEEWPQSLRTAVSMCLSSRFPMLIWWSDELTQIYNDGYRPVLGAKHPRSLGQAGNECWHEIWDAVGPMYEYVRSTGESTWSEDFQLVMERHGYVEETYFTFSYSPIRDESGGVGGVLVTCVETTERVLSERRLVTLRALGSRAGEAQTVEDAVDIVRRTLAENPSDLPFTLLYLIEPGATVARLVASTGLDDEHEARIDDIDLQNPDGAAWPLLDAIRSGSPILLSDLGQRFERLPGGPWPDPSDAAVALPIAGAGHARAAGVLVAGITPVRILDEDYRGFLELAAGAISTVIANARAHEQERERARALAELDRAKTEFLSNVSHEFRTPLTLMLGPIDEMRRDAGRLDADRRAFDMLHRNALRLLRLVNTLLDYSRVDAGRLQASFVPTDVASLTADLASAFRSVIESAGLRLIVSVPPLSARIAVDRDMWEKIVLNLVSNAFKHTFEGEIEVTLREHADDVELAVRDTGTGIPPEERERIFERFHRVRGARSRTQEGTGIGLSLTRELVSLHGGTIAVDSRVGEGTTMTVRIPRTRPVTSSDSMQTEPDIDAHSGSDSATIERVARIEEARRWLPSTTIEQTWDDLALPAGAGARRSDPETAADARPATILIVDDNADLREYLHHLLSTRWATIAASDGRAGLEAAISNAPDLILADVMMPGLDGFALLREIRSRPETAAVPVILLSARAGEESRVEGLAAGADDYLVKPFSARELIARVQGVLETARVRREAAAREREARARAEEANRAKSQFLATMSHELRTPLNAILGYSDLLDAETSGPVTEKQRMHLTRIRAGARHLTQIIEEILAFSRLEAGRETLRYETSTVDAIASSAAELIEPLAVARNLDFRVEESDDDRPVSTDTGKVRQILLNLLSNAVKYTHEGQVRLVVQRDDGSMTFRIIDTGVGIDEDDIDTIFEPFHQVSRAPGFTGGTGLGLAVSRHLAELLGGTVTVHSTPGKGSTFSVTLPVERPAES